MDQLTAWLIFNLCEHLRAPGLRIVVSVEHNESKGIALQWTDKQRHINESHPVITDASNERLQFNHGLVAGFCGHLHLSLIAGLWQLSVW